MAFLVGGANSAADTEPYDIDNSLRFNGVINDGDDPILTYTPAGTSSDASKRKYTFSFWVKRGELTNEQGIINWGKQTGGDDFQLFFDSDDTLRIFDYGDDFGGISGMNYDKITSRLFRDPSAWYHIILIVDTTDGTAGDRVKLYINGVRETSFGTSVDPDQNYAGFVGSADACDIGCCEDNIGKHLEGYISEFHYIDGTAKAHTDFGEFDEDSGIWKPKEYTGGSYGTNGFFMEFKQSGTGTDSSGMGADTSGNDNHLAVTNLTATDQCTDTPTNNFCTLNPLVPRHANFTFNEGSCGILQGHDNNFVWGTMPGKMDSSDVGWYFELRLGAAPVGATGYGLGVGVGDFDYAVGTEGLGTDGGWYMSSDTVKSICTNFAYTANYTLMDNGGSNRVDLGVDTNVGEIIQVAWKNSKVFLGVNNTWYAADAETDGDPANGNNPSHTISSTYNGDNWMPILNSSLAGAALSKFNFGNPPFSISSGNADANGYGNFEYAPPSGFYALCTKNLAEFG